MGLRLVDRRRPSSPGTLTCALQAAARAAGCRLRHGHAWDVVAVSTPLPALGLPAQYRLLCRGCGESGGPAFPVERRASAVLRQPVAADLGVRPSAVAQLLAVG